MRFISPLPHLEDAVVGYPGSAAVVLMHYTDGSNPNYRDNPVKLVLKVADAAALAETIRADGCAIRTEATGMAIRSNSCGR